MSGSYISPKKTPNVNKMKKLNTLYLAISLIGLFFIASCKKDPVCVSSDFELEETLVEDLPDLSKVNIWFDVTNHSGETYNENDTLISVIRSRIEVVTDDGSIYESVNYLPFSYLSAGSTKSAKFSANYGIGKTYKSYKISLFCD